MLICRTCGSCVCVQITVTASVIKCLLRASLLCLHSACVCVRSFHMHAKRSRPLQQAVSVYVYESEGVCVCGLVNLFLQMQC